MSASCRIVDSDSELVATVSDFDETRSILGKSAHQNALLAQPLLLRVVIPVFDEESYVGLLHRRLMDSLDSLGEPYEILFVNGDSCDDTPKPLEQIQDESPQVSVIELRQNFGHQVVMSAGLKHATGQAIVVMDGDLQDPPEVLPKRMDRWRRGYNVVYVVRRHRKEIFIKK